MVIGVGTVGAVVFGGLLGGDFVVVVVDVEVVNEVKDGGVEVESVEVVIVSCVLLESVVGFSVVVVNDLIFAVVEVVCLVFVVVCWFRA